MIARRRTLVCFVVIIAAFAGSLDITGRNFVPAKAKAAEVIQNSVPVSSVSAASFVGSPAAIAANSIVAAFGTQLATGTQSAPSQPLPTTLLNTSVTINSTLAPLFFVSPNQINYLVPPNTAEGDAQVVVTSTASNGDQIVSRGQIRIASVAPAIFTVNNNGAGAPAAVTGRINANGQFVFDPAPPFEPHPTQPGQFLPSPIDVGTSDRPAFLILFGTGLRNAPAGSVKAIIGGVEVNVAPVAAPGFTGLDQINLQLPVSLKGRGTVDLSLVAGGISSNPVSVNLAGNPTGALTITNFSVTDGAIAGQTVTMQGSGFSTVASQNIVRFGSAQARVIAATATQMTVIIPFNAESGRVSLQTPQGETRSSAIFRIRTSISGIVQSTGTATSPPAPLEGVTIRIVGTNINARTNPQGAFVVANLNPGVEQVEIDGGTVGVNPPYPRVALKAVIRPDRDNQFAQAINMQQTIGGSGNVGSGPGFTDGGQSSAISGRIIEALQRKQTGAGPGLLSAGKQQNQTPAKTVVISHRGVTLEIPIGASVRFPDGKTNGQMRVTVLEGARLPGINLPTGVYSSTIAQITPLGSQFSPGASLSFPNPDQARFAPGAKIDLYRYDFRSGVFVKRGTATVTADRTRVVSDGRLVDLASYWLATAPAPVTTVTGRVIDSLGSPVAGAKVSVNGRAGRSDQNGGFAIADVAAPAGSQVQAEAVLPRQYGIVPRGTSAVTTVVSRGVTNVGTITLSDTNQTSLVLSPFEIDFKSSSPPARMEVTLTQAAPSGGLNVTLASSAAAVATVPASVTIAAGQTTASFNVTRVGPGVALIGAFATLSGARLEAIAVITVARPALTLTGVAPGSAPAGAKITISGSGFSAIADNNIVGFVRSGALVAILDPDDNQVVTDAAGKLALRVETPPLSPGAVEIVAATIDEFTGVISDTSAPINFTITRFDTLAPRLTSVSPAQGKPRDLITINGSGFSQTASENRVIFRQGFNTSQARVVRSSATQLSVEVPSQNLSRGAATIVARRVAQNGALSGLSNALDFTITDDPGEPPKPAIASIVNAVSETTSGRDGELIRAQGAGFGRNFYNVEEDDLANDEPLISLLLFYQNNRIVNFTVPIGAQDGAQLTAVIPTGLALGVTQITTVTFDLETGAISDESNAVNFTITSGSLRRIGEGEPNDSPDTATEVSLQTIVAGQAAQGDPGDLVIRFPDGTSENLVDLFLFEIDRATQLTLTLTFANTADLDLFVLQDDGNGSFTIIATSTRSQSTIEQLGGSLPAGRFLFAVGAFSGSSRYSLELRQGAPGFGPVALDFFNARQPVAVERK
ncbi:MAG: IPT/TIG domain-containing protein [Blastocatellia bacterium]